MEIDGLTLEWREGFMAGPASCAIGGFVPAAVLRPDSVAAVGDMVRRAAAAGQAVYPIGGQTMLGLGFAPTRPGVAIELGGLAEVIDYPARDMTITVQAGITIARLQELLRTENQRLPIDVPRADVATLGGVLAANVSGPRRLGWGTLRDYVIGISAVNDEGQEFKAGGRVVKNVAGYDLCKLLVGSLGTLGIITQVTLKLRPLPEERAFVTFGCEASLLESVLDLLHRSRTRPVCLELLNAQAVRSLPSLAKPLPDSAWVVAVGYEEKRPTLDWQIQQLVQELPRASVRHIETRLGPDSEPLWQALAEFPAHPQALLTFKAGLLPSATADFCKQAEAFRSDLAVQAHAGNGIVLGHLCGVEDERGDLTLNRVRPMLTALQTAAGSGHVEVPQAPAAWKSVLPVWGPPRGDVWLMRAIKDKLDPRRLFNPGRFVDGI